VLFPSAPDPYESKATLLSEIQAFIHRYVDLSPRFERIASHYVLLSWLFDGFGELPYLRLRGEFGSGKTRFLLVVGSICYHPIFASGASTVAPIFHILDRFRGTLLIDEGDFRVSDDKADIVKLLNNGNMRGLRILRMQVAPSGEYNPRAFNVFGPKIVATHGLYEDRALESRFLSEVMTGRSIRADIPINLGTDYQEEALALRNKLLAFRFLNYETVGPTLDELPEEIEPRVRQILGPLLSIVDDVGFRNELLALARESHDDLVSERGMEPAAKVVETLHRLLAESAGSGVPVRSIVAALKREYDEEFGRSVTNQWVGRFLRRTLNIRTRKSHGIFVVPLSESGRVKSLCKRYGTVDVDVPRPAVDEGEAGGTTKSA